MVRRIPAPARLFHAVVVTGAALGNACGTKDTEEPKTPEVANDPDGAEDARATPSFGDANTDWSDGEITLRPYDGGESDACPPTADFPYPPCYWIR